MNGPGGNQERESGAPSSSPSTPGALHILSDEQLARLPREELTGRLRARENECVRLLRDRAQLMKDVNRTLQLHLAEVRGLREINQALQKDNSELRDLSCFLDDDRQKARKIAKEWQKFGKYTSTVMRQEVTAYQMKLYELEQKQESLLRENVELKELCLYLDDDREARRQIWTRSDGSVESSSRAPRALSEGPGSPSASHSVSGSAGHVILPDKSSSLKTTPPKSSLTFSRAPGGSLPQLSMAVVGGGTEPAFADEEASVASTGSGSVDMSKSEPS